MPFYPIGVCVLCSRGVMNVWMWGRYRGRCTTRPCFLVMCKFIHKIEIDLSGWRSAFRVRYWLHNSMSLAWASKRILYNVRNGYASGRGHRAYNQKDISVPLALPHSPCNGMDNELFIPCGRLIQNPISHSLACRAFLGTLASKSGESMRRRMASVNVMKIETVSRLCSRQLSSIRPMHSHSVQRIDRHVETESTSHTRLLLWPSHRGRTENGERGRQKERRRKETLTTFTSNWFEKFFNPKLWMGHFGYTFQQPTRWNGPKNRDKNTKTHTLSLRWKFLFFFFFCCHNVSLFI